MFERDPQRIADCIDRLRYSMKIVPWVIVPITTSVISLPGIALGMGPMLFLAITGLIVGFYVSVIIAAFLESMALVLISVDRQDVVSELDHQRQGIS